MALKANVVFWMVFLHLLMGSAAFLPHTKVSEFIREGDYRWGIYPSMFIVGFALYMLAIQPPGFVNGSNAPSDPTSDHWYCEVCQHYCPIRASHCKECNRCVLRRDHHCPWLGSCVGMNNHMFFVLLLSYLLVFYSYGLTIFFNSWRDGLDFDAWILTSLPCTVAFAFNVVMLIQPLFLLPLHFYLIIMNRTTWEMRRGHKITYLSKWIQALSPFSAGVINNVVEFMTMRWKQPVYHIPRTEEELELWRSSNSFCENDTYRC